MNKNITKEERQEIANKIVHDFCSRHQPRRFLSMRLKGQFPWPNEFTELHLFNRSWLLWPDTKWDRAGLVIQCITNDGKEEAKLAMRFLSAFAWAHGREIEDEGFWVVGGHANPCYRDQPLPDTLINAKHGLLIDEQDYLPFPSDEKAQLALALYREGLCVDEQTYKFLSFYKILNIKFRLGTEQINWINNNLHKITDHVAQEKITKLKASHSDVGDYLFVSGRCAVSHAWDDPLVNPDNPDDKWRLSEDLPVIKALSELMIEQEFCIKKPITIWREHLYELQGFREILGNNLMQHIMEGYDFDADGNEIVGLIEKVLPPLSIRLRGEKDFLFERLAPKVFTYEDGRVVLRCFSDDGLAEVHLGLNFKEERLEFNPANCFIIKDDGSAIAAHYAALNNHFISNLFANGHLDVWSGDKLLGRKDAFIPTNIDLGGTLNNYRQVAKNLELLCVERTMGGGYNLLKNPLSKIHLLSTSSLYEKSR